MSIAWLGLYGVRFAGKLPGVAGAAALLGTASLLGALAYGSLIRRFKLAILPIGVSPPPRRLAHSPRWAFSGWSVIRLCEAPYG